MAKSPYDTDLDRNPANFQPLTPLTLLERAAAVFPDQLAIVHGPLRRSYREFYARGNSYREKGNIDRAIADYNEAIRLDPRFSFVYHDRGIAYRMKGDRDHAISDFREAVRLNPDIAGPSRAALESLGVGEPKKEPDAPKRGVLDLLK